MRKVIFALVLVAAFSACNNGATSEVVTDSTKTDSTKVAVDSTKVDSTSVK